MAITIDQASIGTPVGLGTSLGTVAITTNVTIAAGALIVLAVFGDPPAVSVASASGGSLTWTVDKVGASASGDVAAIISAPAPAGLASGTTITATYDAATSSRMIGGMSILGVDLTGSRVDGTPSENDGSGTSWTSASYTIVAGSIIVAVNSYDFNVAAGVTSPSVKAWDKTEAVGGNAIVEAYRIESAAGSYVIAGTWPGGSVGNHTTIAVAYKVAAVAAGGLPPFSPVPFMSNGRI